MLVSFHFAQPLWLLLFIPIFLLLFALWRNLRSEQENAGQGIIAPHLAKVFSLQQDSKAAYGPILLTLLSATLVLFSLAGPSWLTSADKQQKAPLVIALDLSDSMSSAQDQGISTLQRAKLLLDNLLSRGISRPVSLMAFAATSHQVLPPSDQIELLRLYLGYLDPSVMPEQGNDLGGLITAIYAIPETKESGFDLLILSDGFDVDSNAFNAWLTAAGAAGIVGALTPQAETDGAELALTLARARDLQPGDETLYEMVKRLENKGNSREVSPQNLGYWLLYPLALILLYFFRRGFNLYWASVMVLAVNLTPVPVQASWLDWLMTPDQQGAYYFQQGNYKEAAVRFESAQWQAAAFYHAKQYDKAAKIYRRQDDLTGLYNLATTLTRTRNYSKAKDLYQLLLEIDPDNQAAQKNLTIVTRLIDEIQRLADSQQEEQAQPETVDPDEMMDTSLGTEKQNIGKIEVKIEQLSVDELLASEQKKAQWLRDISKDPQQFLAAKFQAQYNKQQQNNLTQTREVGND